MVLTNTRTLVLIIPHWRVIAAGVAHDHLAAVVDKDRVVDVTPDGAEHGITPGIRRREAQKLCADLKIIDDDEERSVRKFNSVVTALESVTPRIEIATGGWCSFPTRGPSRYFGGDQALARIVVERTLKALSVALKTTEVPSVIQPRIGVADSRFAAVVAATSKSLSRVQVVVPEGSAAFLASFPVDVLASKYSPLPEAQELVDVFRRLGLKTLEDVGSLPSEELFARFGSPGLLAQQLAQGIDGRAPLLHSISDVVSEESEIDPPAEHVETAVFVAKALVDRIHQRLAIEGAVCVRILIEVESEHGDVSSRLWRHEHQFTSADITDRVRWQLEGWYQSENPPTGPLSLVRLIVDETVPDSGQQLGFWGEKTVNDERAIRSFVRIQGLLGPDSVTVVQRGGGRRLADIERRVPLVAGRFDPDQVITLPESTTAPWPGRLPAPLPLAVLPQAQQLEVTDSNGRRIGVSGRGHMEEDPVRIRSDSLGSHLIIGWGGPWLLDEKWWDPAMKSRQARFQFLLEDGTAHLCVIENGEWWLEASYE
ncbi:MAG: DNA repair protein [Acidimicrobiales bacterium MED-G01]|nr:MAG: DNA repair protein [Acidimicrobiales bacterium MED-G01]